ncbi:MAG: prolipoprotein diacylglyceryl transferase [Caldilineaceae bacterium]|nr:prolipoprotein diacylglyceryl transferase [Caldilineaceae bacterium]
MFPTLPFGPASLPTGPVFTLLAMWIGLETASRYARRLGLHPDTVWNAGLIAILIGLIVARLWNVVQFWFIYVEQPLLIFSLRPSGFALIPGVISALGAGYAFLVYRSLDPVRMGAALAVGGLAAAAVLNLGAYLTGEVLGITGGGLFTLPYFGVARYPVALFRAAGMLLALALLLFYADNRRPARTIWLAGLGYALVHLICDAFLAEPALFGALRVNQILALLGALLFTLLLARSSSGKKASSPD